MEYGRPQQTEAETEAPETEAPETEAPETEAPETEAPETEAPETEAPETEAAGEEDYPEHCVFSNDSQNASFEDCCKVHAALRYETDLLVNSGKAQEAYELWLDETAVLYDEWIEAAGEEKKGSIVAAKAGFLAEIQMDRTALAAGNGDSQSDDDAVYRILEAKLRTHASWLCAILGTY